MPRVTYRRCAVFYTIANTDRRVASLSPRYCSASFMICLKRYSNARARKRNRAWLLDEEDENA